MAKKNNIWIWVIILSVIVLFVLKPSFIPFFSIVTPYEAEDNICLKADSQANILGRTFEVQTGGGSVEIFNEDWEEMNFVDPDWANHLATFEDDTTTCDPSICNGAYCVRVVSGGEVRLLDDINAVGYDSVIINAHFGHSDGATINVDAYCGGSWKNIDVINTPSGCGTIEYSKELSRLTDPDCFDYFKIKFNSNNVYIDDISVTTGGANCKVLDDATPICEVEAPGTCSEENAYDFNCGVSGNLDLTNINILDVTFSQGTDADVINVNVENTFPKSFNTMMSKVIAEGDTIVQQEETLETLNPGTNNFNEPYTLGDGNYTFYVLFKSEQIPSEVLCSSNDQLNYMQDFASYEFSLDSDCPPYPCVDKPEGVYRWCVDDTIHFCKVVYGCWVLDTSETCLSDEVCSEGYCVIDDGENGGGGGGGGGGTIAPPPEPETIEEEPQLFAGTNIYIIVGILGILLYLFRKKIFKKR